MSHRNTQVYGKRRPRHEILAAQYFIASSSPLKFTTSPVPLIVSPIPRLTREEELGNKDATSVQQVLAKLEVLDLKIGGPADPKPLTNKLKATSRGVLKPRDGNRVVEPKHRIAQRKTKEICAEQSTSTKIENTTVAKPLPEIAVITAPFTKREAEVVQQHAEDLICITLSPSGKRTSRQSISLPFRLRRTARTQAFSLASRDIPAYTRPLLNLCGDPTGRVAPAHFQSWSDSIAELFTISKIAEASYGEVYRLSMKDAKPGFTRTDESVLKIIALRPPADNMENGKSRTGKAWQNKIAAMSAVEDVAGEVRLLQRMSPVPGFTNFRECRVMEGRLPTQFIAAWKDFDKNVKKSLFADPGKKNSYGEDQVWAIVEMQDAGKDLESVKVESVWMCWDVFWGVAIALAKGEEMARFEHRDLHLGNICVRPSRPQYSSAEGAKVPAIDSNRKLGFTGVETTIIDYTISRADMLETSRSQAERAVDAQQSDENDKVREEDKTIAYFDLSKDPTIFEGDGNEDYQYDMYRHMRAAALCGDPMTDINLGPNVTAASSKKNSKMKSNARKTEVKDDNVSKDVWKYHHSITNLVWLHFILYKMAEQIENWPSYEQNPDDQTWEHAMELEKRLGVLQGVLDLEGMREAEVRSAVQLVEWAAKEGWLDESDVVGGTAVLKNGRRDRKGRARRIMVEDRVIG